MKRRLLFVGLGVLALAVGALWAWVDVFGPTRKAEAAKGPPEALRATAAQSRRIVEAVQGDTKSESRADGAELADGGVLSEADQRLVDEIQSALDEEKFDAVKELAEKLVGHPVAAVRQQAVEALGWFGEKALEDLTPFLADADDDVRSFAMMAVDQALTQMEDDRAKLRYIESLFQIRNVCDEDGLAMLAGQVKGVSDETAAVAAAVRVIETGKDARAVREMKEVYEFLTGEPYTTPEAAAQWQAEKAAEDN